MAQAPPSTQLSSLSQPERKQKEKALEEVGWGKAGRRVGLGINLLLGVWWGLSSDTPIPMHFQPPQPGPGTSLHGIPERTFLGSSESGWGGGLGSVLWCRHTDTLRHCHIDTHRHTQIVTQSQRRCNHRETLMAHTLSHGHIFTHNDIETDIYASSHRSTLIHSHTMT